MTLALQTDNLGKQYGRGWALQNCTLSLPAGRICALVGPNGAGKTTLLQLAVGLARPTTGSVWVFGRSPMEHAAEVLPRIGFLAQDHPLYKGFTVKESLLMGRKLNGGWDDDFALSRIAQLGLPLDRKVGKLSGGQQAQVALVLALAKRPDLLLLDEPVAALDPLARRDFLQMVVEVVADTGMAVMLSSHIIADLERVCDSIIILSHAQVQLAGEIEPIVARHKLLVGPRTSADGVAHLHNVVQAAHGERQTSLLVRTNGHVWDPTWQISDVTLEEIVLGYLGQTSSSYIEALEEVPA